MTVQGVTDRANINDDIVNCAKLISTSANRFKVFSEIYHGKKEWKLATEIERRTGIGKKQVLKHGKSLVDHGYARQDRLEGGTAYARDRLLFQNKSRILAAAKSKKKRDAIPTRNRPHVRGATSVVQVQVAKISAPRAITIDAVSSFSAVDGVSPDPKIKLNRIAESRIKEAFKSIIGESHDFKDWGGEKNDLYTNKVKVGGKRKVAAFAFKGKGTSGTLTPKKMGKNGDQLGRLFSSDAEVYFVVYHGKIDESVLSVMRAHGAAKALAGQSVRYGSIDGDDLNRLFQAYNSDFKRR